MFIKTKAKFFGLTLVAILALSACGKTNSGPAEEPSVVLEKSITQASKIYETKGVMTIDFSDPKTKESGKFDIKVNGKSNGSEVNNMQSDSSIEISADIKMNPAATQDSNSKQEEILVNAAGNIKVSGDDMYGTLTKLDIKGESEQVKQANAFLPLFVGPYMNKVVYLPLNKVESIMSQAAQQSQAQGQTPMDYKALQAYSANELPKDLADSKMFVVSKDQGVEKVKSLGKSVEAHHYQIGLDGKGFETFIKKFNEKAKLMPADQIAQVFEKKEGQASFSDVITVLNDALNIQMWIGQKDYHVYKVQIDTDMKKIAAAMEKLKEIDKTTTITDEDMKIFKEGVLKISGTIESAPLKSFKVDKPDQKDVIDLGPMLDMATQGVMQEMAPVEGVTSTSPQVSEGVKAEDVKTEELNKNAVAPPAAR